MSYLEFSTENADYKLVLEWHGQHHKAEMFKGLDALVLEGYGDYSTPPKKLSKKEAEEQEKFRGAKAGVYEQCANDGISIYQVDVDINIKSALLRENLTKVLFLCGDVICTLAYIKDIEKKMDTTYEWLTTITNFLNQGPVVELRTAIAARKIEEYLAPKLAEKLGRKPKIGIIYGLGHAGLKANLKSKKMRNFTLWNWKYFDIFPAVRRKTLNQILEKRHGEDYGASKYHDAGLEW